MTKKHNVDAFKEVKAAKPATHLNKKGLASLRQLLGDLSHAPLNSLKQRTFQVRAICPDHGVKVIHSGKEVWVAPDMLEPA